MFVRFKALHKENYEALQKLFDRLKAYKEAEANDPGNNPVKLDQSDFWDMSPAAQRHFYHWDTGQLTKAQRSVKLPEPRFDDERWTVTDLLHALKTGDYQLDELVALEKGVVELRIKSAGPAFDGLDDLMELLEAFNLPLIGYQESGSYIEVSGG